MSNTNATSINTKQSIEGFLKIKVSNFISYLIKNVGENHSLTKEVKQLASSYQILIAYSERLSKVAKKVNDKYELDISLIHEYLCKNGFSISELQDLDDGNFVTKIKRYLEMFINVLM